MAGSLSEPSCFFKQHKKFARWPSSSVSVFSQMDFFSAACLRYVFKRIPLCKLPGTGLFAQPHFERAVVTDSAVFENGLVFSVTTENLFNSIFYRNAYFVVMVSDSWAILADVSVAFLNCTYLVYCVFHAGPMCWCQIQKKKGCAKNDSEI